MRNLTNDLFKCMNFKGLVKHPSVKPKLNPPHEYLPIWTRCILNPFMYYRQYQTATCEPYFKALLHFLVLNHQRLSSQTPIGFINHFPDLWKLLLLSLMWHLKANRSWPISTLLKLEPTSCREKSSQSTHIHMYICRQHNIDYRLYDHAKSTTPLKLLHKVCDRRGKYPKPELITPLRQNFKMSNQFDAIVHSVTMEAQLRDEGKKTDKIKKRITLNYTHRRKQTCPQISTDPLAKSSTIQFYTALYVVCTYVEQIAQNSAESRWLFIYFFGHSRWIIKHVCAVPGTREKSPRALNKWLVPDQSVFGDGKRRRCIYQIPKPRGR